MAKKTKPKTPKQHWNHRLIEQQDGKFIVAEVYYDNDTPLMQGNAITLWEYKEEDLREMVLRVARALEKPVLKHPKDFLDP